MDINNIIGIALPAVFVIVGIALVFAIIEIAKMLKATRKAVEDMQPTLKNVEEITTNIQPTLAKVDPLLDRVQLTVDSVNLEMMRVDQILEDVGQITDKAASATEAVDNIANAPLKAVNNVASRMKTVLGGKAASSDSVKLAEQRAAVAKALKDFEAAGKKRTLKSAENAQNSGKVVDPSVVQGVKKEAVDKTVPEVSQSESKED